MSLPRLLEASEAGPGTVLLKWVLHLASVPYGIAIRLRAAGYRLGILPSGRLPRPVICVGNITAGGTGKTPVVEALARRLGGRRRVAILMRGYARGPDGSDEANLLGENLPGVEVCTGANRLQIGREALERGDVDLFLLDDGFQHRRLRRDLDIVTIDALRPFGYEHLLPRGLLREPLSALRRARVVAITRVNQATREMVEWIRMRLERIHPKAAIVEFEAAPTLIRPPGEESGDSAPLREEAVLPFCGIGNPESFARTLREMGSEADPMVFPDHHHYSERDIRLLEEVGRRKGVTAWITTQKDAEKVRRLAPSAPLWVVRVSAVPVKGEEEFWRIVEEAVSSGGDGGSARPAGVAP